MPWKEKSVDDQKKEFAENALRKNSNIAQLCRQFNITRRTGYKWIERYKNEGTAGLKDKSRAPLKQTNATPPDIVDQILAVKHKYPCWGPKKVKGHLEIEQPEQDWPSKTTIENIFKKYGLVVRRKLRKRLAKTASPSSKYNEPNHTWCLDFKGWFMTRDGKKCEPFTLMDAYSRYLLDCRNLGANNTDHVWGVLDRVFREFGRPFYLLSDNGPPFATKGVGRLSRLAVRLIKAGIMPTWIEPGKPYQNGRHERMHLTLKKEGIFPNLLNLEKQQAKFYEFMDYYNFVRPHESLDQKRPGDIYQPSSRTWNGKLKSPEYSDEHKIVKVRSCGKTSYQGKVFYVGRVLEGEPIGIKENTEGRLELFYGSIYLGELENDQLKFKRLSGRGRKKYQ